MSPHQVRLEVRLPEGHWSGDVTRANPSAILRIEKHMPLSRGRGTARISCSEDISKSIAGHPGIEDYKIMQNNCYDITIEAGGGGVLVRGERVGVHEPPAVDRVVEVPPLRRAPVRATVRQRGCRIPREDPAQLRELAHREAADAEPDARRDK